MPSRIKWIPDTINTRIGFTAVHLFQNIRGEFKKFNAQIYTEGLDFATAEISFSMNVASLETGNRQRDEQLKSAGFFNATAHEQIKFTSAYAEKMPGFGNFKLKGRLTMKGVSCEVEFYLSLSSLLKTSFGQTVNFTIHGQLNRKDWLLDWKSPLIYDTTMLSEHISIHCDFEVHKTEIPGQNFKSLSRETLPLINYRKAG